MISIIHGVNFSNGGRGISFDFFLNLKNFKSVKQ